MKFSTSVDMGLRLLVYLSEHAGSGLISAPEVSQVLQASYNNVVRIINRLQNAGLVLTHAGRYGGMELALPAEKITVLDVVSAIDGPTKLAVCSLKGPRARMSAQTDWNHNCNISDCSIREELLRLSDQIDTLLEGVTIAAITERYVARKNSGQKDLSVHFAAEDDVVCGTAGDIDCDAAGEIDCGAEGAVRPKHTKRLGA